MARPPGPKAPKAVASLTHDEARRRNIPTAELQPFLDPVEDARVHKPVAFPRARPLPEGETRLRDPDRDPQLIWNGVRIRLTQEQVQQLVETGETAVGDAQLTWRGKDQQDWSDLVVAAPPLYIQEKVHPQAIIEDLRRAGTRPKEDGAPDLFADFNGLPPDARTEFYQHDAHWSNRMILGDSLQVMASLAEREGLRGKVQCIYLDPPYGIKFNSNWQVSTQSRDVKDGKREDISREPEQVKAFRDTWKDGIHSYLTYLRDRLTVARELLTESGSIFVQIGDENVHRVRAVMDEVFGSVNVIAQIAFQKTSGATSDFLPGTVDYIIWSAKTRQEAKFREIFQPKLAGEEGATKYKKYLLPDGRREIASDSLLSSKYHANLRLYTDDNLTSQSMGRKKGEGAASWFHVEFEGRSFNPGPQSRWKTNQIGMQRLVSASRVEPSKNILRYIRTLEDFPAFGYTDLTLKSTWSRHPV